MWHCITGRIVHRISKGSTLFILRVKRAWKNYSWSTWLWTQRQHVSPKHWQPLTQQHSVTSHQSGNLSSTLLCTPQQHTPVHTSAAHSCAHLSSTPQCTPQQHIPVHTSAAHSCAHLSSTLQCTPQQHTPVHTSAAHSSAHLTAYILNVNLNHIGNGNLHQNILSDLVSVIFTDTVKMSMP